MLWSFTRRKQRDHDLNDEIAHDLAADAEERVRAGTPPVEAEQASRRDFGNVLLAKEDTRETWGWVPLERLGQDLRYGCRALRKNPMFAIMAVLSLALGIGANTAIYSVLDAIMLRALPVPNPGQLVILNWRANQFPEVAHGSDGAVYEETSGGVTGPIFPWPAYELLRDRNNVFSTLFAYKEAGPLNLVVHRQAELGHVEFISGNFFSGLEIVPALGRLIADSDEQAGASQVAVLSYDYWRSRFAADPTVIGQTVRINNIPFTIIGVAPPEFFGVNTESAPVVYIPIATRPALTRIYGKDAMFVDVHSYWVGIMGRLRPGMTLERAQTELAARFRPFVSASATNQKERASLPNLWVQEGGSGVDSLRRRYSKPLFILMTMVAFILAIACANIANLLLARATARRREIAVRLSLGASRARVLRQLLTESMLLAVPGGILGLGIAAAGTRFLVWLLAGGSDDFALPAALDWRVLAFAIAVSFTTGLVFGLAPALAATRLDITPALKETRASAPRHRGHRIGLSQLLVVSQIALSLLLVLGAALFIRTLINLRAVELGFNQQQLLTFSLDASQAGYKDAALRAFYPRMAERFRILPGVRAVTTIDFPLVSGGSARTSVIFPGAPKPPGGTKRTAYASVGPTFFETMQLPLLIGRPLGPRDVEGAPPVVVVNEVFARKYFPNQNAIGQHFRLGNSQAGDLTIVGIARNARYRSLRDDIPPVAYIPNLQNIVYGPPGAMFFELRTAGNPLALAAAVRKTAHDAAAAVPVTQMMTHTQRIDGTISDERAFADLCTAFGILALVIACVGLYGTMAYAVARRTNELGIRMALGAERRRIVWLVLREVLALAAAGLALGLLCAWSATSTLQSYMFGMKPADPVAIFSAAAILISALLLAGFAPASRASRIDPLTALRHE